MKALRLTGIICLLALLLGCAAAGSALAQSDLMEAEIELFSAGGLPEYVSIQTFSADDFDSYLYEHLKNGTEIIDLSAYRIAGLEELKMMLVMVVNEHPDLFHVGQHFRYSAADGCIKSYLPEYLFTGDDLKARQAAFYDAVETIADHANRASTTVGKLLLLNDYFCTNYEYDESLSIFRPDQLFSGGTGVCQAYMLGYAAVLDELGIPNTHATSTAMAHTWNVVSLDGDWYHIDVTWNDPTPDTPLMACHDNILLSDSGIRTSGHYDWVSSAYAGSDTYDHFFWRGINTPLAPAGDSVYFLSSDAPNGMRSVMVWNASTGVVSTVCDFIIYDANGVYALSSSIHPIAADADFIYYGARGTLWAADHDGGNPVPVYATGDDDIYIWSCHLQGGRLYMRTGEFGATTSVVSCPAGQRLGFSPESDVIELLPGESMTLGASSAFPLTISSTNEAAFTVSEGNVLTAAAPGAGYITVRSGSFPEMKYPVIVHSPAQLVLPEEITQLGAESFAGSGAVEIILPEGLCSIGANAFTGCEYLVLVHLPDEVESVSDLAFPADGSVTLICRENTASAQLAQARDIPCVLVP